MDKPVIQNIESIRRYPSILMQANNNVLSSVTEAATETVKVGKLSAKLIAQMRLENIREERAAVDVPVLAPLGDDKYWDFKIFPKVLKSWEEMNEKD